MNSTLPTDTIPPEIKNYFFSDVTKPDLLRDYDVLGFDADHCLVKYNVRETVKLLVRSELQELVDHASYPDALLSIDLDDETTLDMCMNGAVFDVDHGLVLKLVEGKEVVRAMKGFRVLT